MAHPSGPNFPLRRLAGATAEVRYRGKSFDAERRAMAVIDRLPDVDGASQPSQQCLAGGNGVRVRDRAETRLSLIHINMRCCLP